jgi:hypothetical protein
VKVDKDGSLLLASFAQGRIPLRDGSDLCRFFGGHLGVLAGERRLQLGGASSADGETPSCVESAVAQDADCPGSL